MQKITEFIGKYKYVALMVVFGILLLAFPSFEKETPSAEIHQKDTGYSIEKTQKELERILAEVDGVGEVQVMLSVASGSKYIYQENRDLSYKGPSSSPEDYTSKSEVVILDRSDRSQDALQAQEIYPSYIGAFVVCDGANDAGVVLKVKEAVSVLTGLGGDRIAVAKRNKS